MWGAGGSKVKKEVKIRNIMFMFHVGKEYLERIQVLKFKDIPCFEQPFHKIIL